MRAGAKFAPGKNGFTKAELSHVGTCLSFSHEDKNLFVVGAENGSIFKCSMQSPAAEDINQITGAVLVLYIGTYSFSTLYQTTLCSYGHVS